MTPVAGGGPRPRLLTPALVTLIASGLCYSTAVGVMIPVLPLFVTDELGATATAVGVAVGLFSATALLLKPLAGRAADRWGRRALLVAGSALFTVVVAGHLLVSEYWALVLLRVLLGAAEAVTFVAGVAALTDLAPPERLGEAISYDSVGLFVGIATGPAIGEWLIGQGGFPAAWAGAVALGGVATLLATLLPALPAQAVPGDRVRLAWRPLVAPGAAFVAGVLGAAGFLGFVALHARDIGMAGAGGALFTFGAVVVGCRLVFATTADRVPAARLSGVALAAGAAGLAVVAAWQEPAGVLLGAALLGLSSAFLTPAFYRVLMTRVPAAQRGSGAAAFGIMVDLGLGGGPLLFGLIAGRSSITAAFAAGAALALIAAILTLRAAARGPALAAPA
jgi:MFS family permease